MTLTRPNPGAVRLTARGREVWVIDNRPTWAFTFLRWRHPEEGRRGWRVRIGPIKAEGTRDG